MSAILELVNYSYDYNYYYNITLESPEYTMQSGPIKKSKLSIQGHIIKKFGVFIRLVPM